MKRTLTALILAIALLSPLSAPRASAMTNAEIIQQIELLQTILALMQKIQELQAQLAAMQQQQNQAAGLPYTNPAWPANLDKSTNKDVYEDGTLLPNVILQARGLRIVNPNPGHYKTQEVAASSTGILALRGGQSWLYDKLEILVNVGNPDPNYVPSWTCQKTGAWSGPIEPYDHWETITNPVTGSYGVVCGESSASVPVQINFVK